MVCWVSCLDIWNPQTFVCVGIAATKNSSLLTSFKLGLQKINNERENRAPFSKGSSGWFLVLDWNTSTPFINWATQLRTGRENLTNQTLIFLLMQSTSLYLKRPLSNLFNLKVRSHVGNMCNAAKWDPHHWFIWGDWTSMGNISKSILTNDELHP